jgi:ribosomal protein S18
MDKIDINLDEDFKNINTDLTSNTDTIGIDLLMGGNSSPKSNMSEEVKSVKTDISDSHSFFKDEPVNPEPVEEKKISIDPINDPIMNNIAPEEYKPVHVLSQTEIKNEKIDLLYKFSKLQNQGVRTSTNYNMNSNLDEMRNEYIKLKKQRDTTNSVKFQRKVMMAAVSGAEFLNSKFDPFDIKLDGWSESVNENIEDFDEVFEQLYEKYGGGGEIAPELKLLMMLGGSAFMFHLSNTMFKSSVPNMNDIMKQNPDLMKQFAKAAVGSMAGQPSMPQQQQPMPNMMRPPQQQTPPPPSRPDMDGPVGDIDEVIKNLNLQPNSMPDLDNISLMSGDSDRNSTKGITLNL